MISLCSLSFSLSIQLTMINFEYFCITELSFNGLLLYKQQNVTKILYSFITFLNMRNNVPVEIFVAFHSHRNKNNEKKVNLEIVAFINPFNIFESHFPKWNHKGLEVKDCKHLSRLTILRVPFHILFHIFLFWAQIYLFYFLPTWISLPNVSCHFL